MKRFSNTPRVQVSEVTDIDLDYMPDDYFTARDLGAALPSDIKGQARRELARQAAAEGREVPEALLASELSEHDRRRWGAVHPALMGGEYLPALQDDEVEIARISLASVTCDQISVRARRTPSGVAYSIVDEYQGDIEYRVDPAESERPLRMRELVALLDWANDDGGAVLSHIILSVANDPGNVEELRSFVRVESDFYPQLGAYYDARLERWFAEYAAENADEDDGEDAQ